MLQCLRRTGHVRVSPFACIKAYGAQDLRRHFVDKISLCTLWCTYSCELSTWSVRYLLLHLVFSPEPRDSLLSCTTKAVPLVLLASAQVALEVTKFSEKHWPRNAWHALGGVQNFASVCTRTFGIRWTVLEILFCFKALSSVLQLYS